MPGTAKTHPCVFRGTFIREQVDPRVKRLWEDRFGPPVPFGNLRLTFREAHCTVINPYGSDRCPYSEQSCAIAFYQCVKTTVENARDRHGSVGYFRAVAKSYGVDRADEKPLARDSHETSRPQGPSPAGTPRPGDPAGHVPGSETWDRDGLALRRDISVPQHIGTLLRGFDPRPRQRPPDDGETGSIG